MKKTVIKNATIVNENQLREGDLLIQGGRIEQIGGIINITNADEINAEGKILLPGVIEDQVHFREPGLTHKATIYSESKAAVAGGVTSYMDMPNTSPPAITHALLEEKYRMAQVTSLANSFYLGASSDNIEEIKATDPRNVCGIKIFMGSSTRNLLVDNPYSLEAIFRE